MRILVYGLTRLALSTVLIVAAVAKSVSVVTGHGRDAHVLQHGVLVYEGIVVALLWTRRFAATGACMAILLGAIGVLMGFIVDGDCRCMGVVALSRKQHVLLASGVGFLGAVIAAVESGSVRTRRTEGSGGSKVAS